MRPTRILQVILGLSLLLRVWLAFLGGQDFWPDESRFERARYVVYYAAQGEWRQAAGWLLGHADHLLFHWWGLPPALWEHFFGQNLPLTAAYFGLFSTLAVFLVGWVARRAGATEREALIATFLAAGANSLFYFSRHLFPYDVALCLMLFALGLGLNRPESSWQRSLAVGAVAGVGFLTYNGYWLLGGCVLALHVLTGMGGMPGRVRRAGGAGAGLLAPIGACLLAGKGLGYDLITEFRKSSETITQGDFRFGYQVIPEYLWHAEGPLLLFWLAGLAAAVWLVLGRRETGRIRWWLGGALCLFFGLVLFSDLIPQFVVYGRLTRTLVPFLCLATGYAIERLTATWTIPRWAWAAGVAVLAAVAAWNFSGPFRQVFPADFQRAARDVVFARQKTAGWGAYKILFAEGLWGRDVRLDLPPHEVLLRRAHPSQYRPYQYEGFSRRERKAINTHDVSMRVVRLTGVYARRDLALAEGAGWRGFPGPVRVRLRFSTQEPGIPQPIVTTGQVGRGDFLFYIPDGQGRLRIGYDNWGGSYLLSEPVAVDFAASHELMVSFGSLYPPGIRNHAELAGARSYLLVELDGRPVLARRAFSHEVLPETITFGTNLIGGSTAGQLFRGSIERIDPENLTEVTRRFHFLMPGYAAGLQTAAWNGAPGPLRLRVELPADAPAGAAQPLFSFGAMGNGDAFFWVKDNDGRVRLGLDSAGDGAIFSEPLSADLKTAHEIIVSIGSMMPPESSRIFAENPGALRLREMLFVALDGRTVLSLQRPFHARPNETVFATNTVGSAAAGAFFTGNLIDITAARPEEILTASVQLARMVGGRSVAWGGYPGPVRLRLRFPEHWQSESEPLIVSGVTGAGDLLVVQRHGEGHIRFALDHWGGPPVFSAPLPAAPGVDHELVVNMGSLMPPEGSALYREQPNALHLRSVLSLNFDGRQVFALPAEFHPGPADKIVLGVNSIGGSTAGPALSAFVLAVREVSVDEIRRITPVPFLQGPPSRGAEWLGYPGPIAMKLVVPPMAPGEAAPLITTGMTGAGDLFFVRQQADGTVRFGLDHWGISNLPFSDAIALSPGQEHSLVVSLPSLMPPPDAGLYATQPQWRPLREMIHVELDGRVVWRGRLEGFATSPEGITYGANFIGASSAGRLFKGILKEIVPVSPQQVLGKAKP